MTVAANRTKKEKPTRIFFLELPTPIRSPQGKKTMMITNNPEKKHKTMGTSTMRFHSQALDLHNCNTKKQGKITLT
jgi:ribosomal protein S10